MFSVPDTTAYGKIVTKETKENMVLIVTPNQTELMVREYFKDIPIMIQVARCESTFRHTLVDGTVLKGQIDQADTGVMQINQRYHGQTARAMGLNLNNLQDNLEYARFLYERQGTQPWQASSPCWGRTLAMRN